MTVRRDDVDRHFFDEHQWETIEAAMARIIPTDGDPGAREAHTIVFVDRYLSGIDYIYAKPDGSGFRTLSGKVADVWQKRVERLREKYLEGIADLNRIAQEHFSSTFVRLSPEQQDQVLQVLAHHSGGQEELLEEEGTLAAFEMPEASMQQAIAEHQLDFFPLLALHTRQGYYADPVYGGNRDHLGWNTIGFPGPDSMAEVHQGRFCTLPYFAEQPAAARTGETE